MKTGAVQNIIYLVIIFCFANHGWSADWIFHTASVKGDVYYDKSSIKKANKNISYVHTKTVYNEDEKKETFSMLISNAKAPKNPGMLSHALVLFEIDCINATMKDFFTAIYDKQGDVIYWSTKGNAGQWKSIQPDSVDEKLKNIVCKEPVAPDETVASPNVEKPDDYKDAMAVARAFTDKNPAQVNNKQDAAKFNTETEVRNLVTQWLASWQAGDMKTYRSCYASDFKSKGMNLDAWIGYKTKVHRKSKNIAVTIDDLQISVGEHKATAVFTQYYNSSIFKDSGKKKLALRKTNSKWEIYQEMM